MIIPARARVVGMLGACCTAAAIVCTIVTLSQPWATLVMASEAGAHWPAVQVSMLTVDTNNVEGVPDGSYSWSGYASKVCILLTGGFRLCGTTDTAWIMFLACFCVLIACLPIHLLSLGLSIATWQFNKWEQYPKRVVAMGWTVAILGKIATIGTAGSLVTLTVVSTPPLHALASFVKPSRYGVTWEAGHSALIAATVLCVLSVCFGLWLMMCDCFGVRPTTQSTLEGAPVDTEAQLLASPATLNPPMFPAELPPADSSGAPTAMVHALPVPQQKQDYL